jgi:hypothetical protein
VLEVASGEDLIRIAAFVGSTWRRREEAKSQWRKLNLFCNDRLSRQLVWSHKLSSSLKRKTRNPQTPNVSQRPHHLNMVTLRN